MKTKIIILEKMNNINYVKIGEAKLKKGKDSDKEKKDDFFTWQTHKIPFPPKNAYTFSTGKVNYIFFDIYNKKYITFYEVDLGLSTEFLEELFGRKIVSQLVKAVKKANESDKTNWDFIKTGIIAGIACLLGYLIGIGGI